MASMNMRDGAMRRANLLSLGRHYRGHQARPGGDDEAGDRVSARSAAGTKELSAMTGTVADERRERRLLSAWAMSLAVRRASCLESCGEVWVDLQHAIESQNRQEPEHARR